MILLSYPVLQFGIPFLPAAVLIPFASTSKFLIAAGLLFVALAMLANLGYLVVLFRREVKAVAVDEEGIHLLRRFNRSDDWAWSQILFIRPAPRREVLWDGLIRPWFSPKERSACNSLLGHYRIQGKSDYCFFPPKNPDAFVEAIARYRPDLLKPAQE